MNFFKRKAAYPHKRTAQTDKEWERLWESYKAHLQNIKKSLPESAWKLACLTFHDAKVLSVARPSKSELIITLRGGHGYDFIQDAFLKGRYTTLSFFGVRKAWVPDTIVGDDWLYEEVNLSKKAAFDYQVLLWKDEIRIEADDVKIRSDSNAAPNNSFNPSPR